MEERNLQQEIQAAFGIIDTGNDQAGFKLLVKKINELLDRDFQKLISILYRMDVNEEKLRRLLRENQDTNAGLIIANMMIERQQQKLKSRRETKTGSGTIEDEEKW